MREQFDFNFLSWERAQFSYTADSQMYTEKEFQEMGGVLNLEEDKEGGESEELLVGGNVEQQQGMFYKTCNFRNEKERARAIMDAI